MTHAPRQLDVLHDPDPEQFVRDYVLPERPAVLKGVAGRWKAMRWTPEYFRSAFAGVDVRYEIWDGNYAVNDPLEFQARQTYVDARMGEFIDLMLQQEEPSRKYYCAQFKLLEAIPQLRQELGPLEPYMGMSRLYPRPVKNALQIAPFLWLGPAGVVSGLHFDRSHNLFVQLHGRKKWLHFPPEQGKALYYPCAGFLAGLMHFSPVDPEHPDLERFPRFAEATPIETTVEPGDMVFTPAGWWHHVRGLEASIAMNFFWQLPVANAIALRRYLFYFARRKALEALNLKQVISRLETPG